MNTSDFTAKPGEKISLKKVPTVPTGEFPDKDAAKEKLAKDIERMAELQDRFYADSRHSLLIIFQALDAAGKDGAIKHVMSGINPQGCQVASFKAPSSLELSHDYLWRCKIRLPQRGHIGIFNRSYYEEVIVVRVHPNLLAAQNLPPDALKGNLWKRRYREINDFEKYLTDNGTRILKFYLHLSKDEQKRRFLQRIDRPEKNWKLSASDVAERAHWKDYQEAYEEMIEGTSTGDAPWHIIPADKKWFARVAIAHIVVDALEQINPRYPEVDAAHREKIEQAKQTLLAEKD